MTEPEITITISAQQYAKYQAALERAKRLETAIKQVIRWHYQHEDERALIDLVNLRIELER